MQQLSYSGANSASMCRRCVPPTARTALEARIVSVCASYAQFSLFAMKRDGRKGSANPSRPMESRRLTPPRLDRNRNAHPSAGIGGAFLVRKNAVSASQKQRGPSCGATRRKRPLCLVLRRAILLPRAAELSLPVCRLPSQAYAQWLTFVTQLSLFRCILALTVPFAVGFVPFPSELPPDQRSLVFTADSHTTSPDPIYFMPPRGQRSEYTPRLSTCQ